MSFRFTGRPLHEDDDEQPHGVFDDYDEEFGEDYDVFDAEDLDYLFTDNEEDI